MVSTLVRTEAPSTYARPAGFTRDLSTITGRALRNIPREPGSVIAAILVPTFFFFLNTGALQELASTNSHGFNYKSFFLPLAIIFSVSSASRAPTLVTDIQSGYFDRLCMTPVRRSALLLGLMFADFLLVLGLSVFVLVIGLISGVRFDTGFVGCVLFVLIGGTWGLAFAGFFYALALRTGSPTAVNAGMLLFVPFCFLTTAIAPMQFLAGWLQAIATVNPVTYVLLGMRSLLTGHWALKPLLESASAIVGVGIVSMTLAGATLRGRVKR
jgi:ABC-2 type transport system permease protein